MAASSTTWITEKAEANLIDGKVVTGDKDSAVLLGLSRRAKLFLPVQVKTFKKYFAVSSLEIIYNRGGQSAALQLAFVALGPFWHLKETLQISN